MLVFAKDTDAVFFFFFRSHIQCTVFPLTAISAQETEMIEMTLMCTEAD